MAKRPSLATQLTSFEGVFCSGFFIPNPATVTALALLFERVHFLNQLEYVIELSGKYRVEMLGATVPDMRLMLVEGDAREDPLAQLPDERRRTVHTYLFLADQFFMRNALLFPSIFHCSLLPQGQVLSIRLVKRGAPGKLNTYEVKRNSLRVSTEASDELVRLVSRGCIPIVSEIAPQHTSASQRRSATQLAAALAIKSVAMILPGTRAVEAEQILEARDRLKDHLPPFWSSMLKLSVELSGRLQAGASDTDVQDAVDDAVSTIVKPALIELVTKLEKERKHWFHRILLPISTGLRVLAGRPPMDLAGMLSATLTIGSDVATDVAKQLRKVEALKQDSGLTYAIELHKFVGGSATRRVAQP